MKHSGRPLKNRKLHNIFLGFLPFPFCRKILIACLRDLFFVYRSCQVVIQRRQLLMVPIQNGTFLSLWSFSSYSIFMTRKNYNNFFNAPIFRLLHRERKQKAGYYPAYMQNSNQKCTKLFFFSPHRFCFTWENSFPLKKSSEKKRINCAMFTHFLLSNDAGWG